MAQPIDTYYYNCKVSQPILHQDAQSISFNGLAWSNSQGMIHETNTVGTQSWQAWLGTQP